MLVRNMAFHFTERNNGLAEQKKELKRKLAKVEANRENDTNKSNAKLAQASSELESMRIQLKMANDKAIIVEGCLSVVEDEKKALTEKVVMLSNLLGVANDIMTSVEMRLVDAKERATMVEKLWKAAEA